MSRFMALNHAFLMVVHDYPEQVAEIVHLLDATNHFFFIHIDKKSSARMMETPCILKLKQQANCTINSCMSVNWGGVFTNTSNIMFVSNGFKYNY